MKKIPLILMSIFMLVFFTACSNDDESVSDSNQFTKSSANHFYGVKSVNGNTTKGVALRDKLWYNGTVINVKLLNDPYSKKETIKKYASEWEKYANIKFNFVEEGKADIRIGFDWNDNRYITWSYIGTDCKFERNQNEATMSFSYWDSSTEKEIKGDVLRAFGTALGLELEHRHLEFDAGWTDRIAEYWEGEMSDIPWLDMKEYVFDPISTQNLIKTQEYDENSIMIWPFSKKYAKNTARDFNYELSAMDIEFISKLYPMEKESENLLIKMVTTSTANSVEFGFTIGDDVEVDWGDGIQEAIIYDTNKESDYRILKHTYKDPNEYTVKIYGHPDAVLHYSQGNTRTFIRELYFEKCTGIKDIRWSELLENLEKFEFNCNVPLLTYLGVSFSKIKELDLSNCSELITLRVGGNSLTKVNLSNNKKLIELRVNNEKLLKNIDISNLTELDDLNLQNSLMLNPINLSNNKKLKTLMIHNCGYKELDISNCLEIQSISIPTNNFEKLDMSKFSKLKWLNITGNPIINDKQAMIDLALSLPHGNSSIDKYPLWVGHDNIPIVKSYIGDICDGKNWVIQ